jgi:hypothetical protein
MGTTVAVNSPIKFFLRVRALVQSFGLLRSAAKALYSSQLPLGIHRSTFRKKEEAAGLCGSDGSQMHFRG